MSDLSNICTETQKLFTNIFRPSPHLSSFANLSLLQKYLEVIDSSKAICEIRKLGGFLIRETVAMVLSRRFLLSQKITKWRNLIFSKFTLFLRRLFLLAKL